ncbi:DUF397 domain-containing protein [Marinactinospora rubrisoli]|uniref:DUF397 domain-containing protein n=1 Tax=Marinactinospora rubrisoli TaxID=2715399 RepID=A0ABW2KLJ4_9ACTN
MSTDQTAPTDGTEHLTDGGAAPPVQSWGDTALFWRKSSHSDGPDANCAEVAMIPAGKVALRDSKRPAAAVLPLSGAAWRAFVAALKHGRFD